MQLGKGLVAGLFGALLAAGCGSMAEPERGRWPDTPWTGDSRTLREYRLGKAWTGRRRVELQRDWGVPTLVLNLPGFQQEHALILVYFGRDAVGGCIDAFVVWRDVDETIGNYICR